MPRSALLAAAAAAILIAAPDAGAAPRPLAASRIACSPGGSAIRPAVVMFQLAIVRLRMLHTLTELIRSGHAVAPRRW